MTMPYNKVTMRDDLIARKHINLARTRVDACANRFSPYIRAMMDRSLTGSITIKIPITRLRVSPLKRFSDQLQ